MIGAIMLLSKLDRLGGGGMITPEDVTEEL